MRIFDSFTFPNGSLFVRPLVAPDGDRAPQSAHQDKRARQDKVEPADKNHCEAASVSARPSTAKGTGEQPTDLKPSTAYWRGASGRLYRHSAHTTVFCPAPQRGVYVLARRNESGGVVPLFAGVAASPAGTLNLAHIRRRAVTIGATEVHLCPVQVTGSVFSLRRVARDLRRSFASAV